MKKIITKIINLTITFYVFSIFIPSLILSLVYEKYEITTLLLGGLLILLNLDLEFEE